MSDLTNTAGLPPVAPGQVAITDLAGGGHSLQIGRARKTKMVWLSPNEALVVRDALNAKFPPEPKAKLTRVRQAS